jgi:WD40 repeat protein
VAFADDGTLLACIASTRDHRLAVWDVTAGREIWGGDGEFHTGHLTPNGRLLAGVVRSGSVENRTVSVLEIPAGRLVSGTEMPGAPLGSQIFSPDGRWLVSVDEPGPGTTLATVAFGGTRPKDVSLNLQSFPTGDKHLKIVGPTAPTSYAFDPDGRLLVVGYQDGSATIWNIAKNEEIFRGEFCSQPVSQLAFMPGGNAIAVTDGKSTIQMLDLKNLRRQLSEIGLNW